jgi:hypothetical protein
MSKVLLVNIGAGPDMQVDEQQRWLSAQVRSRRKPVLFGWASHTIRQLTRTLVDAQRTPVDAQSTFYGLSAISHANPGTLDVHRFAADTGIFHFRLDDYRKLEEIERLTNEYINKPDVEKELIEVAQKLAQGWRAKQNPLVAPLHDGDGDEIAPHSRADSNRSHFADIEGNVFSYSENAETYVHDSVRQPSFSSQDSDSQSDYSSGLEHAGSSMI